MDSWEKDYTEQFVKAYEGILSKEQIEASCQWQIEFIRPYLTLVESRGYERARKECAEELKIVAVSEHFKEVPFLCLNSLIQNWQPKEVGNDKT